jgi:hypothetical protein
MEEKEALKIKIIKITFTTSTKKGKVFVEPLKVNNQTLASCRT